MAILGEAREAKVDCEEETGVFPAKNLLLRAFSSECRGPCL